jgi:Porin subfamily
MRVKSLLLGSAAMLAVSTPAFSAELVGDFALGTCDALGISGLTIESPDNCLAISGGVEFEFSVGDYNGNTGWVDNFPLGGAPFDTIGIDTPTGSLGSESSIDWWLQFVATADSDFGAAKAWLKLVDNGAIITTGGTIDGVRIEEAAVSIGSEAMALIFGKTGTIYNDDNDEPLNFLGLMNAEMVDEGVGVSVSAATGGQVIQAIVSVGDGITAMVALEDLQSGTTGSAGGTLVGTIEVDQDWGQASASLAYDDIFGPLALWNLHAGITVEMEMATIVAAFAADSTGYWNGLVSGSADLDIFTLAGSAELNSDSSYGLGGSVSAEVADGITLYLGARFWDTPADNGATQIAGKVMFDVTEAITATAEAGIYSGGHLGGNVFYAAGNLEWNPGGDFTASISGEANSLGAYKVTTAASKSFN